MLDIYANEYNLNNPLENKMPIIIEAFVKYYGEKYRDIITQKLNDTTLFFLPKYKKEGLEKAITHFKNAKLHLVELCVKKLGVPYDKDCIPSFKLAWLKELKKSADNHEFTPNQQSQIDVIKKLFKLNNKIVLDFQMEILINNLYNIFSKNYKREFNKINSAITELKKHIKWFDDYDNQLKEFQFKQDDTIYNYISQITKIPVLKLVEKHDVIKNIDTFITLIKNGKENWNNPLTDCETINNKNIKLFNLLGFDYGNDYQKYMSDINLKNIIFDEKISQKINIVEVERTNFKKSHLNKSEFYTHAKDKISTFAAGEYRKSRLLQNISSRLYDDPIPAFVTYYYCNKDKRMKSICCLPYGFDLDDYTMFHELNHIVASNLIEKNRDYFVVKSGLDKMYIMENNQTDVYKLNCEQDIYEMIDEVINDYISIDLQKQFEKDGYIVSSTKYNKSVYASAFGLLDKFIKVNKEYLKENIISPIYKNPNQEFVNFDELAKLTDNFVKNVVYNKEFKPALKEISNKIKVYKDVEYYCKDYLDEDWSDLTKKFLSYYKKANELAFPYEHKNPFYNYDKGQEK